MDDGRGRMEWAEERESQSPTHLPTGWLVCAEEHGVGPRGLLFENG